MKDETYIYLWENAFQKAIDDVLCSIPDEVQREYNLSYVDGLEKKKELILQEYNIQRQNLRTKYFDMGEQGEKLIDIHKVCACFTAAMLKVRVFQYTAKMPMKVEIFYSNYTLAFLVGIHIMYLCLLSDLYDENQALFEFLKDKKTFVFPETNKGHDEYVQGRIKTLALNDIYEIDFDLLTYADMLFWIEKYNKDILIAELPAEKKEDKQ